MKRNPTALDSSSPFDLIDQPFRLLNVHPSSTVGQISDAYALALAQEVASQDALARARESILEIGLRLSHELAYPIDSGIEQADSFYDRLVTDESLAELVKFAASLAPLSRANFLAHIAARRAVGSDELTTLVEAHASVDPNAIYDTLKRLRHQAGLSPPSLVIVGQELQQLFCRHTDALLGKYGTALQTAAALYGCTLTVLANGGRHRVEALSAFIDTYRRFADAERSEASAAIEHTCANLQQHPNEANAFENLRHVLTTWRALSEPLLAIDAYRNHHDESTEAVLDHIRVLLAELSSNHHFSAARNVVDLACASFRSVPPAVRQFEKASQLLQKLASEAELKKLDEAADLALSDPNFVKAVEKDGFGTTSSQPALDFWRAFSRAIAATKTSEYADRPWAAIHDFVIHLNDRPEHALATANILSGIVHHAEHEAADPAFTETFHAQLRDFQRQHSDAPGKRSSLGRIGRRAFLVGPIIVGFAGAFLLYRHYEADVSRVEPPATSQPAAQVLTTPDAEVIPPVGRGQRLELNSVRYCRFQEERLRIVKQHVKGPEDVRAYNMLAGDYNSRCSDFFFQDHDQKVVSDEIEAKTKILEADAMRILATWPWHSANTSTSR